MFFSLPFFLQEDLKTWQTGRQAGRGAGKEGKWAVTLGQGRRSGRSEERRGEARQGEGEKEHRNYTKLYYSPSGRLSFWPLVLFFLLGGTFLFHFYLLLLPRLP